MHSHLLKRGAGARLAFTLIELVVVVVIIGVLAALAVLSLGGTMDRYQLSRAAETIEMFDAHARRDARNSRQPIQATIQRDQKRLLIETVGNEKMNTQYRLPNRVEIKEIRMRRRVTAGGEFQIQYSREGWSATYALQIQRGNMSRWFVVLGVSGQVVALENEGEVDEILSL